MNTSRLLPLFVLISFVLVVAILYKKSNSTGDVTQPNIIEKNIAIVEDEVNENYVKRNLINMISYRKEILEVWSILILLLINLILLRVKLKQLQ